MDVSLKKPDESLSTGECRSVYIGKTADGGSSPPRPPIYGDGREMVTSAVIVDSSIICRPY